MRLWVDSLCIDQPNVTERTSQVRMMKTIYSQAALVVVWLGEAAVTDDMAIELLRAIVQELICAREVTIWCGDATLNEDFPVLEAAHLFTMHNCNIKTQIATTVLEDDKAQYIRRLKLICAGHLWGFKASREQGPNGMLWYLLVTRYFDATDLRDKIFALVGLVGDFTENFVDYSKSYADVVQELSLMVLEDVIPNTSGSMLEFLSCITRDEHDDLAGVSWVVDWLKLKDSLYTPLMNQFTSEAPTISQSSEVQFLDTEDGEILHVDGIVFNTITHIVPSPISMHQPVPEPELVNPQHILGCIAWVDEAIAIVRETLTDSEGIYRASGESLYDAFWRTLCCNRSAEQPTHSPTDDSSYRSWRRLLALHEERLNIETKIRRTFAIART
ncbi:Non-essential glycogen phosphorylase [Epicoccum nigrum]|nr:Non-essential glycogen phosphorylase [Epicoccum nigrum]